MNTPRQSLADIWNVPTSSTTLSRRKPMEFSMSFEHRVEFAKGRLRTINSAYNYSGSYAIRGRQIHVP